MAAAEPDEKTVALYAAHQKIYPRSVKGTFANWRWIMVWVTQIIFYGVPWLEWGQRQAVLFDLSVRRFYLFGLVLYPQDLIYMTGLLVVSALSLFLFTAVAGRLWCGYACPQTVYTEIFLWFEKLFEGDRSARMRRDQGPMTAEKFARKAGKQFAWVVFSLWTGFTFVGYFAPIRELASDVIHGNMSAWGYFWIFFYSFATYGNAGFMREQVCKHMCPYARFQSAMFDKDTLIVTYDAERGEPRGARSKKADPTKLNLGACVDCGLCVQVCPTGIDIRNGLQYECIGCGACADVCDTVMEKVGYPKGLVRYSTENAVLNHWSRGQIVRRVLRPRILIYTTILLTIIGAISVSLAMRTPFKADVVRDRGVMARVVEDGKTENVYSIQIMNATESDQRYKISVSGIAGLVITSDDTVRLAPTQARWVPVRVQAPFGAAEPGSHVIHFAIESLDSPGRLDEKSTFVIPKQ
ncbi:MAG: cytochrome c oxidase accessory protein CcoG [Rhodoferax sp.]